MENESNYNEYPELEMDELLEQEGYDSDIELLEEFMFSSLVPVMCACGAQVEPDGQCEHGNRSILLFMGMI